MSKQNYLSRETEEAMVEGEEVERENNHVKINRAINEMQKVTNELDTLLQEISPDIDTPAEGKESPKEEVPSLGLLLKQASHRIMDKTDQQLSLIKEIRKELY